MTTTAVELHELGVCEIAAGVADRSLSPVEVVESLLARAERYDGTLKAWSYLDPEDVRSQAATLAAEAAAGQVRGPLHGVPIAVKEQFAVAGIPQLADPNMAALPPSPEDATAVARLRAAGAIVMGKLYMVGRSGTPPTRNPWNIEHTPGGSSSGSGAAVGARFVPLAMAEQTGGSGLRPAAYCGVAGYKPTYGAISRFGMFAMSWSHDHACINARSMADIALAASVLNGYDERDPTSLRAGPPVADLRLADVAPPRIGVVRNFFPERTEPEMQAAVDAAARTLADAGALVSDVLLPDQFGLAWPAHTLVGGAEGATVNARTDAGLRATGTTPAQGITGLVARDLTSLIPATYYLQSQRIRRLLRARVAPLFERYDALLTAVAPGPAPRGIHTSGDWTLLMPWSHLGNPAITLNGGLSAEGLPLGLQFGGPVGGDYELLRTGAWCERALGRLPAPAMDWG